jgi:regulator of cell morphogenesis and NO signaling
MDLLCSGRRTALPKDMPAIGCREAVISRPAGIRITSETGYQIACTASHHQSTGRVNRRKFAADQFEDLYFLFLLKHNGAYKRPHRSIAMNARLETTAPALNAEQALGQIAVELPGATAVFRRLKLDFCCGGQVSLRQAAAEKGLDLNAVLAELAQLQRPTEVASVSEPGELIDHILSRYHEVHRAQLPELIRMAHRVEAVHCGHPQVPAGLGDFLEHMEQELLSHMMKEEQVLFPMLKAGGNAFVVQPISMMRHEHVDHGESLDKLNALTNDATPPAEACNTWRALYAGIAQLNDDLINHIHLENNVLFPQFEASQGCGSGGCGCA